MGSDGSAINRARRGLIAILLFQALLVAGLFAAALDGTRNLVQALQNAVVVYVTA
jgi:hypothetical protein